MVSQKVKNEIKSIILPELNEEWLFYFIFGGSTLSRGMWQTSLGNVHDFHILCSGDLLGVHPVESPDNEHIKKSPSSREEGGKTNNIKLLKAERRYA